jgi:hypothetical protein
MAALRPATVASGRLNTLAASIGSGLFRPGLLKWGPLGSGLLVFLLILAMEAAGGAAIIRLSGEAAPILLAAFGNLLAGLRFGWTLRPGAEPLISRYGRHDVAGLPDADGRYTRHLTALWALVLGAFGVALLLAAAGHCPAGPLLPLEPALCAAIFLGEHLVRRHRFPQLGRVTPLRTIRAIYLSHRVSHRQAGHAA